MKTKNIFSQIANQKIILIFLVLITSFSIYAQNVGDIFQEEGVKYEITSITPNVVAVKGLSDIKQFSNDIKEKIIIPSSISNNSKKYSVTSIGDKSFSYCENLKSVTIPSSVTNIGILAFVKCTSLESVTIPSSVKSIGGGTFHNCPKLKSVTIPSSVTYIGIWTFLDCPSLTKFSVDSKNTEYKSIDGVLFNYKGDELIKYPRGNKQKNYTIPSSVKSIGEYAFYECTSLTSITIPSSVKSIGDRVFSRCTSLTKLSVDSKNTLYKSIDGVLFNYKGDKLILYPQGKQKKYTIPSSVTSVGDHSFCRCSLTSIIIPVSVKSIGKGAFIGCTSLKSVTIPVSVTTIGDYAFQFCDRLTSVTIHSSVKSIGYKVFDGCTSLTWVTIPSSVKNIDNSAFLGCTSLTSVTIPSSVTSIGGDAFSGCTSLSSITIPSSVTSIGGDAFLDCKSLTRFSVDSKNTTYKSIDGVLFNFKVDRLIQYPIGSKQKKYIIPSSVSNIGNNVFDGFTSLTKFSVGSKNTTYKAIDGVLFNYKGDRLIQYPIGSKQRNYTIPSSVNSINYKAFKDCKKLESITIPSSVTSIGTFKGCISLTKFSVDSKNTVYKSIDGVLFNYKADRLIQYPSRSNQRNYTIPSSVTSIGMYAFYECTSLTSITIPSSLVGIDYETFGRMRLTSFSVDSKNTNYKAIDGVLFNYNGDELIRYSAGNKQINYIIPSSVIGINYNAFEGSQSLSSITIPSSVRAIGNNAFEGCASLASLNSLIQNPNDILIWEAFQNIDKTKCTLYVPKGTIKDYKSSSKWNVFKNIKEK